MAPMVHRVIAPHPWQANEDEAAMLKLLEDHLESARAFRQHARENGFAPWPVSDDALERLLDRTE